MKKTDCKCLICNFSYAVKHNQEKMEAEFLKVMTASMEHHFDNHEFCNPSLCHFQEDSIWKSANGIRGKLRNIHLNLANQIVYDEVIKSMIHSSCTKIY